MTIKERAEHRALAYNNSNVDKQDYFLGYCDGATEQKQIDIDKACEAFCIESKCRNRVNLACRKTCEKLKCFREAMEE